MQKHYYWDLKKQMVTENQKEIEKQSRWLNLKQMLMQRLKQTHSLTEIKNRMGIGWHLGIEMPRLKQSY